MRAPCLSILTMLALVCLWQPGFAQDAPRGDKGASPARLGTLSPDEARRAERARKRRAGAAKPVEVAAPSPAPAPTREAKTPAEPPRVAASPQRRAAEVAAPKPSPVKVHARATAAHRDRFARVRSAHAERRRVAARREDLARDRWVRNRRIVGSGPRWTPRVGDVVPAGVPLYPVQRAYGYAPVYGYQPQAPGWEQPAPVYGYPQTFGYGYADE